MPLLNESTKKTYIFLFKWMFISVIAGVAGVLTVHSFMLLLSRAGSLISDTDLPMAVWLIAGAVVTGGVIYRIDPRAAGEGIPSYIQSLRSEQGSLPLKTTLLKYLAGLVTLSAFNSGGVVGPLGRTSAGVVSWLVEKLSRAGIVFKREDIRTASICGLAAVIGTVFHSSIGAGILAVEVIQRSRMGYSDLFPAIMSSCSAVFLCKAAGWESFYRFNVPDEFMDISMTGWLIVCAVISGIAGGAYEKTYIVISKFFRRKEGRLFFKVLLGSLAGFVLCYLVNPELMGTSRRFIPALLSADFGIFTVWGGQGLPVWAVLGILLCFKLLTNCIVVGSGMSAGFTGPAVISGMLLGGAFALLVGVEPGSATYYAFICAGFAGLLGGSMNVPIASSIMAVELFGLEYSFAAGLASVVAFQMSRGTAIYTYAVEENSL
ncbi:MAG: chloride channel protein [Chitinivibrionales bacterium]